MDHITGPQHAHNAHQDPKGIEQRIGAVFFEDRTPSEQHRIDGVEEPDGQEWAFGTHPAYHTETADAHYHSQHFQLFQIAKYELIGRIEHHFVFLQI